MGMICPGLILSCLISMPALAGVSTSGDFNGDGFADLAVSSQHGFALP
jgi:hypothetical protein